MGFEFITGQCVNHELGSMASIVVDRRMTLMGREHYRLKTIATGGRRDRWVLGDYLVPSSLGSVWCMGCRRARACPLL